MSVPPSATATYERLQSGPGDVSLRQLVAGNPLLWEAILPQLRRGAGAITGVDVDPQTGAVSDVRIARVQRRSAEVASERG